MLKNCIDCNHSIEKKQVKDFLKTRSIRELMFRELTCEACNHKMTLTFQSFLWIVIARVSFIIPLIIFSKLARDYFVIPGPMLLYQSLGIVIIAMVYFKIVTLIEPYFVRFEKARPPEDEE